MIKSYTDLQQSKKLAEILPLESADMYYHYNEYEERHYPKVFLDYQTADIRQEVLELKRNDPCWSLAALLDVLPDESDIVKGKVDVVDDKYMCTVCIKEELVTAFGNNPIDACYDMILKLNKLKML